MKPRALSVACACLGTAVALLGSIDRLQGRRSQG